MIVTPVRLGQPIASLLHTSDRIYSRTGWHQLDKVPTAPGTYNYTISYGLTQGLIISHQEKYLYNQDCSQLCRTLNKY